MRFALVLALVSFAPLCGAQPAPPAGASASAEAAPPQTGGSEPVDLSLHTIPARVFKEDDGSWAPSGTESWTVALLLREAHQQPVSPVSATAELLRGESVVRRVEFSAEDLASTLGARYVGALYGQDEVFDVRAHFSAPRALEIDRMRYTLRVREPGGAEHDVATEVALERYEPRTALLFPLAGPFMVASGHAFDDPHSGSWSQDFADDIIALGPHYEVTQPSSGLSNESFVTWGAEVLAPAAGTVIYARNDMPDNPVGEIDVQAIRQADDPRNAIGGNNVIIDHGNGEYSFLAHLMEGSVRVQAGDAVLQGQVVGRLGNSGNSDAPHLHYHLMDGPEVFRSNGLPTRFANVYLTLVAPDGEGVPMLNPRRGVLLEALPPDEAD